LATALAEIGLADKVVRLHQVLDDAGVPHAFGGALALAYYGEPRVTVDIDVNVFVEPDRYPELVGVLEPLGIGGGPPPDRVAKEGQARLWWGRHPVDVFFAYDPVHEAMRRAARSVPFGHDEVPVLAPEHLLVAKVVFNRAKDWLDIEQMLLMVAGLDLDEVHRWLEHLLGPQDGRRERLRGLEAGLLGRP
jgi:hypothetical protein